MRPSVRLFASVRLFRPSSRRLFCASLLVLTSLLVQAQTLYVTPTGGGNQSGSSWTNALPGAALPASLSAATAGAIYRLAGGLYKPTTTTDRTVSFNVPSGVQVYGGYVTGTDTRVTNPSSTTLSGDIDGNGAIDDANSLHVITMNNASAQTRLDGLCITLGNANGAVANGIGPDWHGGGLLTVETTEVQLVDCQFIRNSGRYGGAIGQYRFSTRFSATITNCLFRANAASRYGGAIGSFTSLLSPVVTNCAFVENTAGQSGGAIGAVGSLLGTYSQCEFIRNSAGTGGAIGTARERAAGGTIELRNCRFLQNVAQTGGGGAIFIMSENFPSGRIVKLLNCSFTQNSAVGRSLFIYKEGGGAVCVGALYTGTLRLDVTNCSFSQNSLTGNTNHGGAILLFGAAGSPDGPPSNEATLTNCLFWQNGGASTLYGENSDYTDGAGGTNPNLYQTTYSLFDTSTGYTGANNGLLTQSPFVDADAGNLQLTACSPAVNAGDPASTPATSGTTDAAGQPRFFQNGRVDIGAFERQGTLTADLTNAGELTCARTSTILSATATGAATGETLTYAFSGPGLTQSGPATSATATQFGTYTLTVTGAGGCSVSATTTVTSNTSPPTVSVSNDGPLTCTRTSVTLSSTASAGVSYSWRGPNGFSSSAQSVSTATAGGYSLVVTAPNGCTASASTTVASQTTLAPPSLLTQSGQASTTVPQYSGSLTLVPGGCAGGSIRWTGPNNTTGTGKITVPTVLTGTFVYSATCQVGVCTSAPSTATVIVQAAPLQLVIDRYDCASRQLVLRTTGGNGQDVEYHINSVTTGWDPVGNTFVLEAKHIGRELKLRARQRNPSGGWNETEISFTPTACESGRAGAAEESRLPLQVTLLGNPVTGATLAVEVRGAEGQPLRLQLSDQQGRPLSERAVEQAGAVEHQTLELGTQPAGLLLLRVSTPTQIQTVKLLKAD